MRPLLSIMFNKNEHKENPWPFENLNFKAAGVILHYCVEFKRSINDIMYNN